MSILSITKQDGFLNLGYILKNKIKPTLAAFISLVRVGYSVFFEQVFMRIGFMMTAIMAAKQGTDAMAAHQVGGILCRFRLRSVTAFSPQRLH